METKLNSQLVEKHKWPNPIRQNGQTTTEFVYTYLKDCIILMEASPGELITEQEIADLIGVSRTPIRETFTRLQGEHLIEIVPRRGALIAPLTLQLVRELAETRFVIEGYAVRNICRRSMNVESGLDRLVKLQAEQYESNRDSVVEMIKIDRAFHTTIVDLIGNSELSKVYRSLEDRQLRSGIALFQLEPKRKLRAIDFHQQLVLALGKGAEAQAIDILEQHLMRHLDGMATWA